MTARQRAMFERKTDAEPNSVVEHQLMSLPTGYKEKVMTAEAIQKAALKSLKRKQLADEKREKDKVSWYLLFYIYSLIRQLMTICFYLKKKTMERLLKKQESKTTKFGSKSRANSKRQVPLVTYKITLENNFISLPLGEQFPLQAAKV